MNSHMSKSWYKVLFSAIVLTSLSACGANNTWVRNADIRTYDVNGDIFGEVTTSLNTGGILLPSVDIPIVDPKNPTVILGQLSLKSILGGNSNGQLGIAVNLTELADYDGSIQTPTLPNGSMLPVLFATDNIIELKVGDKNAKVYVGIDVAQRQAVVGAAIPIEQFDGAGRSIALPVNIFPQFVLANGVNGAFGMFTSPTRGQNGIALFVDVSSLLAQPQVSVMALGVRPAAAPGAVQFVEPANSKSNENKVLRRMKSIEQRGGTAILK